ncbi:amidohydrolase family protein [Bradyrhizobium sp. CCGB12]|uniref:amidohydrolase family protein n=1 Tax=Bradyrhizobium sp. CCGB12 TaxID=2949632 RepID=UPI0020B356CF|nr:amidohydrolase family protein [Bradyrhizobium sp. CCGB12]MCP3395249.1 amidohydrolase family protein [Bradyrhizobium sp. CCGB12]
MLHFDGIIKDCLEPRPASVPNRIKVPAGAWETHAHVIGAASNYPFVAGRHFNPPPASPSDFVAMLDSVGIQYGVVVQVSVHGTDNRLLVQALQAYPNRLCGVAVIDPAITDKEVATLKEAGVRGIRILDIVGGGVGLQNLEILADRCAEVGWHIQVATRGETYPKIVDRLLKLRAPFIIDHMGWCAAANGVDSLEFQTVLHIVRNSNCYVKLSGGFRLSAQPYPFRDVIPFAQALIAASPDRMVWGSDWPHVGLYDPAAVPDVGQILDGLADYAADAGQQHKIMVSNPARFYGAPVASSK